MRISDHISYEEATRSQTAVRFKIDNSPDAETLERMKVVANACFEPLRKFYGKPLIVSSFYRCEKLNKKIGGSKTSQHITGEAIDIDTGSREENKRLFDWAVANLQYDQIINEYDYSWVHISYRLGANRNQVLKVK